MKCPEYNNNISQLIGTRCTPFESDPTRISAAPLELQQGIQWSPAVNVQYELDETCYQNMSGWWYTYPSEKYGSQLEWLFRIYGKIKMFQTTNQMCYTSIFSGFSPFFWHHLCEFLLFLRAFSCLSAGMEFLQVFVFIYLMGVVAPVAMCNFTQAAAKIVLETSCVLQLLKRHLLPSGN